MTHSGIDVVAVDPADSRAIRRFVTYSYDVYEDDEHWVSPLVVESLERLTPGKNPYLQHSSVQPFLATREGAVVGRITAHENTQHTVHQHEELGFFGFFEANRDQAVADTLFGAAAKWLSERGLTRMRGPANFSVNRGEVGLLVDGFDSPPVLGMPYNPRYYPDLFDHSGLNGVQDLFAFHYAVGREIPERVRRIAERVLRDPRLVVRKPDMKRYREEFSDLRFIFRESLDLSWGAVPMTDAEFECFADELKRVIDPDVTFIAEYDGEPVGFSIALVDMNRALQPSKGRLFSLGILNLLLKKRTIEWARVPALGVRKTYRRRGIDAALYYKSMIEGARRGYRHAELSWVPESNREMTNLLNGLGAEIYKTYRMYEKLI